MLKSCTNRRFSSVTITELTSTNYGFIHYVNAVYRGCLHDILLGAGKVNGSLGLGLKFENSFRRDKKSDRDVTQILVFSDQTREGILLLIHSPIHLFIYSIIYSFIFTCRHKKRSTFYGYKRVRRMALDTLRRRSLVSYNVKNKGTTLFLQQKISESIFPDLFRPHVITKK